MWDSGRRGPRHEMGEEVGVPRLKTRGPGLRQDPKGAFYREICAGSHVDGVQL